MTSNEKKNESNWWLGLHLANYFSIVGSLQFIACWSHATLKTHLCGFSPTFKMFSSPFHNDYEEVPTANRTHWSSMFRRFEVPSFLLATFLISIKTTCFHLNNSPTLSPWGGQQIYQPYHLHSAMNMFDTTNHWDQMFSKIKHVKSTLYLQLSTYNLSDVLLLSTSSFNPDITSFWDCKQH